MLYFSELFSNYQCGFVMEDPHFCSYYAFGQVEETIGRWQTGWWCLYVLWKCIW